MRRARGVTGGRRPHDGRVVRLCSAVLKGLHGLEEERSWWVNPAGRRCCVF
jgi:hypothetical protein